MSTHCFGCGATVHGLDRCPLCGAEQPPEPRKAHTVRVGALPREQGEPTSAGAPGTTRADAAIHVYHHLRPVPRGAVHFPCGPTADDTTYHRTVGL